MNSSFITLALREALKSPQHHRIGAVLVKSGNVLAKGYNCHRHAEVSTLSKCWPSEREGTILYVARPMYHKKRKVGLAKPCPACYAFITGCGVKRVYYTSEEGVQVLEI